MKKTYISPVCNCSKYANLATAFMTTSPTYRFYKRDLVEDVLNDETDDNWSKDRSLYDSFKSDENEGIDW